MTCDHADCGQDATVRCRFGDGHIDRGGKRGQKQTFVHYCDPCFQHVATLFHLCDIEMIPGCNDGPFGPFTRPERAGTMAGLRV